MVRCCYYTLTIQVLKVDNPYCGGRYRSFSLSGKQHSRNQSFDAIVIGSGIIGWSLLSDA